MTRNLRSELTFNFSNAAVAMVDASAMSLEVLTGILSGCGFRRMFRCTDMRQGGDIIKQHSLDLIMIDPYGFGEDAYNFIKWLRSDKRAVNANAPIIITTA